MFIGRVLFLIVFIALSACAEVPFYGVASHVSKKGRWDFKFMEKEFSILNKSPIRWVRTDFNWSEIAKKGEWNFDHLDRVRDNARKYNVKILPILGYSTPKVAGKAWEHTDEWLEYVRKTVSRYKNDFRYWEVYNEQNLKVSGEKYAEFLKKTYLEIKKVDPGLQVVMGGLFMVPIPWLEKCFKAGGATAFDILAIHPYAFFRLPEWNIQRFRSLKQLMKKYKVSQKPIWITELGSPTNFQPELHGKIVKAAMKYLKINPAEIPLVCVHDIQAVVPNKIRSLFKKTIFIPLSKLKDLDPQKYPVLMPVVGERFLKGYHNDLKEYVRKGGNVILIYGQPFYYEVSPEGIERQVNAKYLKKFHIAVDRWWTKTREGVPKREDIHSVTPEFRDILQLDQRDFPTRGGRGRFLSERNLETGDQLIPMIMGSTKNFTAPVCGIYKLNSSMKGSILLYCNRNDMKSISEEYQAAFLIRNIIIADAFGIEVFIIYCLRSRGIDPEHSESYYGLLRKDLSPKPSFMALKNFAALHTARSEKPVLKQFAKSWTVNWTNPKGEKVWAIWSEFPEENKKISIVGSVLASYDLYGEKIDFTPGMQKITFTPIYVVGPTSISIQ